MKIYTLCFLLTLTTIQVTCNSVLAFSDLTKFSVLPEIQRYEIMIDTIRRSELPHAPSSEACKIHVDKFIAVSHDESYRVRNKAVILLNLCSRSSSADRIGERLIELISSVDERPQVRSNAAKNLREMGLLTPEIENTILMIEGDESYENNVAFYAKELHSVVEEDRWNAVGRMFYYCERFRDWGDDEGEGLTEYCTDKAISAKLIPVIKELLTSFDNSLVAEAPEILHGVKAMKLDKEVGETTIQSAVERAQQQHDEIKQGYDSNLSGNGPGKSILNARMEITDNAIRELQYHLSDW